jgi:hypothetical protein
MNHHLPKKQFDVTFVRTQFATATVLAADAAEAWDIAKAMALAELDQTEVHIFPDHLQPDWTVDDVALLAKSTWEKEVTEGQL